MSKPVDRIRVSSYSRAPSNIERTFYSQLVAQLAARRVALKLTQEDLDRTLGVSDGQVAKWESFLRLPGAFMLMCWASSLGISIVAAVELKGETPCQAKDPPVET